MDKCTDTSHNGILFSKEMSYQAMKIQGWILILLCERNQCVKADRCMIPITQNSRKGKTQVMIKTSVIYINFSGEEGEDLLGET